MKVHVELLRIGHEVVGSLSGCIVDGLRNGCIVMVALASDLHCIERIGYIELLESHVLQVVS